MGFCKLIEDYTDRLVAFQGCFNFRDIGGYVGKDGKSIKWGMYYRAGRQDRLTDMDKLKLAELNVSTQIDLRKPEEIADQGVGPLGSTGAQYEHIPVIPEGGSDQLSQLVGDTGISGEMVNSPTCTAAAISCMRSLPALSDNTERVAQIP